jgi:adenylate kinase family enzyme
MGGLKKLYKDVLPDAALRFVVFTTKNLLQRDTVRSAVRGEVRRILTGSREKAYQIVPTAEHNAERIVEVFNDRGISPRSICIDGPPGSGKSTLGRSLAKRTGLKWRTLYWQELKEAYPFIDNRIYENIRLIRTQDVEHFDVIIYIDCPAEVAIERVITRDRNAALADLVDFSRLKKIGDTAFEMLGGEEIKIGGSPIRIKPRPQGGYRDLQALKTRLREKGYDVEGFSKEELLFLFCYGRPQAGLTPYIKLGAYNNEILAAIYDALARSLARRYLT